MNLEKVFNFIKEKKGYDVPLVYELNNNFPLSDGEINYKGSLNISDYSRQSLNNIKSINGDLYISGLNIKSLDKLIYVTGNFDLGFTCSNIKSLGNLQYVGKQFKIESKNIESLGNLKQVDGNVILDNSNIKSLGNLKTVRGYLNLSNTNIESLGNLKYVGYYLILYNTPISRKYTEEQIRQMVEVKGEILLK